MGSAEESSLSFCFPAFQLLALASKHARDVHV